MPNLSETAAELLDRPIVAALTTLQSDGSPQTTAVWVGRDGDDVLVPVKRSLHKTANMRRDPRVTLLLIDPAQQERSLEVRGTVRLEDDPTSSLAKRLTVKYDGVPMPDDDQGPERLVARITPTRVRSA